VVTENMKSCCVHASLMAFDETTEGFAITLSRPVEVWILVSHSGNYKVLKPWTTNEPPPLGP
jgi:hypothetical protein